jgi:glutathione peroxidase
MSHIDSLFDIKIRSLDLSTDNLLGELEGFVLLHVNIATKTGYKPKTKGLFSYARTAKSLWELQKLHEMFNHKKFSVVGYPCNQFNGMEQGTNEEILKNIKQNFPFVTFPISEKVNVNGQDAHNVWKFLNGEQIRSVDDTLADTSENASIGQNKAGAPIMRVPHNYEKFLTKRNGGHYRRFNWADSPLYGSVTVGTSSIIDSIHELL